MPFIGAFSSGRTESRQVGILECQQQLFPCDARAVCAPNSTASLPELRKTHFSAIDPDDVKDIPGRLFGKGIRITCAEMDDLFNLRLHDLLDTWMAMPKGSAPGA